MYDTWPLPLTGCNLQLKSVLDSFSQGRLITIDYVTTGSAKSLSVSLLRPADQSCEPDLVTIPVKKRKDSAEEQEAEIKLDHLKTPITNKRAARLSRGKSPPLLLAFSITSERDKRQYDSTHCSPSSTLDLQKQEDEDWDQPIEEWMILGEEEQEGDSCIQLNLHYWNTSDEDNSRNEG